MGRAKRTLQHAFITTVSTTAATVVAAGCAVDVTFGEDDVIGNPPGCIGQECCPSVEPANGSACPELGLSCSFGVDCADGWAECTDNGWETYYGSCNPPPAVCPETEPVVGAPCEYQPDSIDGYPSYCSYDVESPCGTLTKVLGCEFESSTGEPFWAVVEPPASCELPPSTCHTFTDGDACNANVGCSWLVPGCAAPALSSAGCYAVTDCSVTGACGDWGTCETRVHDPCYMSLCQACGSEIDVCLPNPD